MPRASITAKLTASVISSPIRETVQPPQRAQRGFLIVPHDAMWPGNQPSTGGSVPVVPDLCGYVQPLTGFQDLGYDPPLISDRRSGFN